MKLIQRILLRSCICVFSFVIVLSAQQAEEIITVSEKVGDTIDAEEREKYKLFPGKGDFVEAVIVRFTDGTYGAKITSYQKEKLVTEIQEFPDGLERVRKIREYINHFEEIQKGEYELGKEEGELFNEYRMNTKDLGSRRLDDVNEDGLIDFVYINDRKLSFFIQSRNGFSKSPDQVVVIDSSAIIFDINDLDRESPGKEIVILKPDGIFSYNQDKNGTYCSEPVPIYNIKNASTREVELNDYSSGIGDTNGSDIVVGSFVEKKYRSLRRWNFIEDITNDGLKDLILPLDVGVYQFFIRNNNNSSFTKGTTLNILPRYSFSFSDSRDNSKNYTSYSNSGVVMIYSSDSDNEGISYSSSRTARVEKFYLEDYNGDKKPDVVFKRKKQDIYFAQNEKGRFSSKPLFSKKKTFDKGQFRQNFRERLRETYKKEKNLEIMGPEFIDLNRDGVEDILCIKMSGGIFSLRSVLFIYYGSQPGEFPEKPSRVFVSEGILAGDPDEICKDFNGDGKQDLVLPYFKISLTGIIKILITRNISVKYHFYLCNEKGTYPSKPTFERDIDYKFSFSEGGEPTIAKFDGDFNGDGLKDMLIAPEKDKISLYFGNREEVFPKDPSVEIEGIKVPNDARITDLNNDWKSDIYFRFRDKEKETEELVVLLSK